MKFFNYDLHISVIADIRKIFNELGHEVNTWSNSGHNWVFNKQPDSIKHVDGNNWHYINNNMIDAFYNEYKDKLEKYDAFICCYPSAFSLLYEKFNKPIIIVAPIRYDYPFCNNKQNLDHFNSYLKNGIDNKKIIPCANNKYDALFCEYFTGKKWQHISSFCEYTNTYYTGISDKVLLYQNYNINLNNPNITYRHQIGNFQWEDICKFKAIVNLPYACSTMSGFEHYCQNIPLYYPSKEFIIKMSLLSSNPRLLEHLTWHSMKGLPSKSTCTDKFLDMPDPNDYNSIEMLEKWIPYCDFYDVENMPYLIYFDSFDHLNYLINTTSKQIYIEISEKMKIKNIQRKVKIYQQWKAILENL